MRTLNADNVRSMIDLLTKHYEAVVAVREALEAWTEESARDGNIEYTDVDRIGQERMERVVKDALYALWEGSVLHVHLQQAHDPWVLTITTPEAMQIGEKGPIYNEFYVNASGLSYRSEADAMEQALHQTLSLLKQSLER